ncbi:MAG TPA: SDR family NAD(P)-dependent oxidoreductase, partial [Acidimicrobiales bacterium]|nr:SDR family NAD(P)-dependent oxidoreductase [Acidimicrobiales bacterium]
MAGLERLDGRVALVTGAGRGIGRADALVLAELGAAVVVNDLGTTVDGRGADAGPAGEVATEIIAAGGRAVPDTTDVASIEGGAAAVKVALEAFGRLDVLVNNAGFAVGGGDVEHPVETEIDALIGVHLKAALGTMRAAVPVMRSQGYGRIVNTVSEVALDARLTDGLGYGAAKAALWSVTLSAARALTGRGITVNAISPGARTRMNADL